MVARVVRDDEAAGSSPAIPTMKPLPDPLNIRQTTAWVMQRAEHVAINQHQITKLIPKLKQTIKSQQLLTQAQFGQLNVSPQKILVLDTINFCFWAKKNQPKWQVKYPTNNLSDGWQALVACIDRAMADNIPILDAQYLSHISLDQTDHLFRSSNQTPIPLIQSRQQFLQQTGRILAQKFQGNCQNLINQAQHNAVKLTQAIIHHFPSFKDTAKYKNKTIYFYKRAQICVYDLSLLNQIKLTNLNQLTIFADYKLPQLLRHFKVLNYSPALSKKIDSYQLVPPLSPEEIEIRSATIQIGELLAQQLKLPPAIIDNCLWQLSQKQPNMKPYHHTLTTNY